MSQTIPDFITRLSWNSGTGQEITTDAVSENVIEFGSSPQQIGLKDMYVEFLVKTAFAGMASGLTIELRIDLAASLADTPIVIASRVALAITDLTAGDRVDIPIPPIVAPSTYVYFGAFYNLVSQAATGGAIIASIKQGGESVQV